MRIALAVASLLVPAAALAQTAAVQSGTPIGPGKWQITSTVTSMDMPDVPPFVANLMKKARSVSQCITPEQAAQGPAEMLKRDKSCQFTRYNYAGGKLDAVMQCKQGNGTTTVTSRGTYTPTSFDAVATIVGTGSAAMTMTVASQGKLTGPCKK